MYVYLNSRLIPAHAAVVSVFDRGFAYGDSLFETVKVKRGRPVFFLEHCQRLIKGMEAAGISAALDIQNLKEQAITLARVNSVAEGRLRIQVTRGTPPAPGGPDPDLNLTPTLLVRVDSFAGYPERLYTEGMACRTVPLNRGHFASLKSTNLLATILARAQAHAAGAGEAIFTSGHGRLLEGAHTNIFFKQEDCLLTASEAENILPGVVRGKIVRVAEELGLEIDYRALKKEELDLPSASAFLTSSLLGVCPVSSLDDITLKIDQSFMKTLRLRLAELEEESISA